MKSFVINVASEAERLAAFTEGYPACLPPFEVVDCLTVETCSEPAEWWDYPRQYWAHRESMIKALEAGLAAGKDFLFFEDDAIFAPDFEAVFTQAVAELPAGWDMLYLGGCHLHSRMDPPWQITPNLLRGRRIHWNTAFLVNVNSARRIIDFLADGPWPCVHVADYRLNMLHFQPDFMALAPMKFIVGQCAGRSTMNGCQCPEKWGNAFWHVQPTGQIVMDLSK